MLKCFGGFYFPGGCYYWDWARNMATSKIKQKLKHSFYIKKVYILLPNALTKSYVDTYSSRMICQEKKKKKKRGFRPGASFTNMI